MPGFRTFSLSLVTLTLAAAACSSAKPETSAPAGTNGSKGTSDGTIPTTTPTNGADSGASITNPNPTVPGVRYVGRFDTSDAAGPKVGWPGATVTVRWSGTSLKVKLAETSIFMGPSEYDVTIDGTLQTPPLVPTAGTNDYTLASDLTAGEHVVEMYRRTEGNVGLTQFLGFDYGGGTLLPPPAAAAHKIEFLGDSESAGYGVLCTSGNQSFDGSTENEHEGFTSLVASALGAEHHTVAYSGKGVYRNYDDGDADTFGTLFPRLLPDDASSQWSFASWTPDAVFIALGTNDFANAGRAAPDVDAFKTKYAELVATVRSKYPAATIFCAVEPDVNDGYPSGWNAYTSVTTVLQAVVAEHHAANDAKVEYYEFPRADSSTDTGGPDLTGCDFHPNAAFDKKIAPDAAAKIKSVMGW